LTRRRGDNQKQAEEALREGKGETTRSSEVLVSQKECFLKQRH